MIRTTCQKSIWTRSLSLFFDINMFQIKHLIFFFFYAAHLFYVNHLPPTYQNTKLHPYSFHLIHNAPANYSIPLYAYTLLTKTKKNKVRVEQISFYLIKKKRKQVPIKKKIE